MYQGADKGEKSQESEGFQHVAPLCHPWAAVTANGILTLVNLKQVPRRGFLTLLKTTKPLKIAVLD
jgi:hypothetical protein